jgi:hypothetical protein
MSVQLRWRIASVEAIFTQGELTLATTHRALATTHRAERTRVELDEGLTRLVLFLSTKRGLTSTSYVRAATRAAVALELENDPNLARLFVSMGLV